MDSEAGNPQQPPESRQLMPEDFEDGLSLEELSQTYSRVLAQSSSPTSNDTSDARADTTADGIADESESVTERRDDTPVSPLSIVEAILFVGTADGSSTSASDIAKVIRGVSRAEVVDCIRELNAQYVASEHAFAIVEHPDGFRLELCPDLEPIRENFYTRSRPITLNQAAIDCIALIAYQPGIARDELEQQRGQPSGSVLNQLVRRELVSIERREKEVDSGSKKKIAHYFPTEKLLELAGLASLEDLPQVEDLDHE